MRSSSLSKLAMPETESDFLSGHLAFHRRHKTGMHVFGNGARLHAFINRNRLLRGVADHEAVRAFGDMTFQLRPDLRVRLLVEKIRELGQEFLTCKQKRCLPCA